MSIQTTTLGSRIAIERERLGLTQIQVATLIGKSPQSISNWENDRAVPRLSDLQKLGQVGFDVSFVLDSPKPLRYPRGLTKLQGSL